MPDARLELGGEERGDDLLLRDLGNTLGPRPFGPAKTGEVLTRTTIGLDGVEAAIMGVPEEELVKALATHEPGGWGPVDREGEGEEDGAGDSRQPGQLGAESNRGLPDLLAAKAHFDPRETEKLRARLSGTKVRASFPSEGTEEQVRSKPQFPREERGIHSPREEDPERVRRVPKRDEGPLEYRAQTPLQNLRVPRVRFHGSSHPFPSMNSYADFRLAPSMPDVPASGRTSPSLRRALFVDRDGTLTPDLRYLKDANRLELYRGVGDALSLAHDHGFLVICVTNQSGVERGLYTREDVERIHERLNELLVAHRARVDAFYYCPHTPESKCECRKPGTLLFRQARDDWNIDLASSAIVGDRALDVEAGRAVGLFTAFVASLGHEQDPAKGIPADGVPADVNAESFSNAVLRVLARG